MWIVPEAALPGLVDEQPAFAAMSRGDGHNFPVMR